MLVILGMAGLLGVVQSVILEAWVVVGVLCVLLLLLGVSPLLSRQSVRHHLEATYPVDSELVVLVSDDSLQLKSPTVYCEYSLGAITSVFVKRYGVHMTFGSGVISLPRVALDDPDIEYIRAIATRTPIRAATRQAPATD